jgi:hypothetical protein
MSTKQQKFIRELTRSSTVRFAKRFRLFSDEIAESLALDILQYMVEFDKKAFEKFGNSIYGLSIAVAGAENRLSFEWKIEMVLRASRLRFTSARKHLRRSLSEFSKAQEILREEMSEVVPGTLQFREVGAGLKKLSKAVVELEADGSALIHRQLRTKVEKALAQQSKIGRYLERPYPISQKSSKLTQEVVATLDKVIRRFDSTNKVPSNHIDKFIARFFAVLGITVEEENIKTIRGRLKKLPKAQVPTVLLEPHPRFVVFPPSRSAPK